VRPTDLKLLEGRGVIYTYLHRGPEERAAWLQILKLDPNSFFANLGLANYYQIRGEGQRALHYYQGAKRMAKLADLPGVVQAEWALRRSLKAGKKAKN